MKRLARWAWPALTLSLALAWTACAQQAPLPVASVPVNDTQGGRVMGPAVPPPAGQGTTGTNAGGGAVAAMPSAAPTAPVPARVTPDAPFRQEPPAAGPEPTFQVPAFKRFKLKSGLEVLLAEFHDLPLVDVHLLVKTGGAANPQGESGLADLTANMLDEGTKTRTALQIAEQIGNLGASLQTSAGWDSSLVTMSTITRNLDAALDVWADVIVNPAFTEADLSRVRDNLLTAISRRKDSPPTVASQVLARVLFGEKHPYAWPQTGVEESLKKLGVADLRKFYETYYHPGNAAVVVAGDISEADLRKKLNTVLASWRPRGVPKPRLPAPAPATKDGRRIFLVDKAGAPQSSIRVGTIGVDRANRDYFPIIMMNQILGGAFYRLDMNLRERQQWTYGARSVFEMRRTPGPMAAGGEFVADHTADAVAEILKEMRLMTTTEVTDEEIARAKDGFVRSFPARFATRASTAAVLGELATYDLPSKFLTEYTKKIQAVTKADIQRVAAKYLPSDKMAIVVVGDRESQEAPLGHVGNIELRDLDGAPLPAASDAGKPGAKPSGEAAGKAKAKASARPD